MYIVGRARFVWSRAPPLLSPRTRSFEKSVERFVPSLPQSSPEPQSLPKVSQSLPKSPKVSPKSPQSLPKSPQSLPKSPQSLPKVPPGYPQATPGLPPGYPTATPRPKVSQSLPKSPKMSPKVSQSLPKWALSNLPIRSDPDPIRSDPGLEVTSETTPGRLQNLAIQGVMGVPRIRDTKGGLLRGGSGRAYFLGNITIIVFV